MQPPNFFMFLRYLCDRVVPGNRITINGVYSIKKMGAGRGGKERGTVGTRSPYIRVLGIQIENIGPGRSGTVPVLAEGLLNKLKLRWSK